MNADPGASRGRAVASSTLLVIECVQHATRRIRRRPGRSLLSVIVLGLGLAVLVTGIAIRDSVLTEAAPYPQPERLVWIGEVAPDEPETGTSLPMLRAWLSDARTVAVAGFKSQEFRIGSGSSAQPVLGALASASMLRVLRVSPILGRGITAEDDAPDGEPVALISYRLWRQRFAGRASAVGGLVDINGVSHRIVGVLPAGFAFPRQDVDVWLSLSRQLGPLYNVESPGLVLVVGRLQNGASAASATAELSAIVEKVRVGNRQQFRPFIRDLRQQLTRDVIPRLRILLFTAVLVLVLASANVSNLAVADLVRRRAELSVKTALGAGRTRIIGEIVAESLLVGLGSCAVGTLLAVVVLTASMHFHGATLPELARPHLGMLPMGGAAVLSLSCSILIALGGLAGIGRAGLSEGLRAIGGGQSVSRSGARTRDAVTVLAVAVTAVLLVAAGTLGRSFLELSRTRLGFASERVLTARLTLPYVVQTPDNAPAARAALTHLLVAPVFAARGWQAAVSKEAPSRGNQMVSRVTGGSARGDVRVGVVSCSSNLFTVLGIPLLRGTAFASGEQDGDMELVISAQLAARLWPGENPIGRLLTLEAFAATGRVVGVAGDVRQSGAMESGLPQVYFSYAQLPLPWMTLLVSADGDLAQIARTLRAVVSSIEPSFQITRVEPLQDLLADGLAQSQFYAAVLSTLAGLSVVLTLGGLYSVLALFVAQRGREIGIRMSLGATPRDVLLLVLRRSFVLAAIGAAGGMVMSLSTGSLLRAMLIGVSPTDPLVIAGTLVATMVIAAGAALVPARRATLIDPARAVRAE